jgi:peptidoglycan/LPS O-acetylase OafA/YrhL
MNSTARRLDHLTGLRGVAAYSVLLAHAVAHVLIWEDHLPPGLAAFMEQLAYLGMSIFFVLSGFVIHYNYAHIFRVRPFLEACRYFFAARFARLYPLYALAIVLASIDDHVLGRRLGTLVIYAFAAASWFNQEILIYPLAWSISTEAFFYFAFALAAPFLWRIKRPLLWLAVSLVVLPAALLCITSWRGLEPILNTLFWHDDKASAEVLGWFTYFSPYVRIGEFCFGVLTSAVYLHWREKIPLRGSTIRWLEAAAVCWCLALPLLAIHSRWPIGILSYNYGFAPALVVIMLAGCSEASVLGAALRLPLVVYAGEISYSVYIWQWWAEKWMRDVPVGPLPSMSGYAMAAEKMLAVVVATTLMAYVSYHLFERPTRLLLRTALMKPMARRQTDGPRQDASAAGAGG